MMHLTMYSDPGHAYLGVGEWLAHLTAKPWFLEDDAAARQVIETILEASQP